MHPDEGTIHAYVEGQLPAAEQDRVAGHVAACAQCGDAVAEARGIIAAASRIVTALDDVPANVIPARRVRRLPPWIAAAAAVLLAVGVTSVIWRPGQDVPLRFETQRVTEDAASGSGAVAGAAASEAEVAAAVPAAGPSGSGAGSGASSSATSRRAAGPPPTPGTPGAPSADRQRDPAPRGRVAAAVSPSSVSAVTSPAPPLPPPPPPSAPPPPAPPPPPPPPGSVEAESFAGGAAVVLRGGATATASQDASAAERSRPPQADRVRTTAAPAAAGAAAFREQVPVPLRVVRYDAGQATVELREYAAAPPRLSLLAETGIAGINEYRWTNASETRVYVLTGPFSVAELEELARRLEELPVVP